MTHPNFGYSVYADGSAVDATKNANIVILLKCVPCRNCDGKVTATFVTLKISKERKEPNIAIFLDFQPTEKVITK